MTDRSSLGFRLFCGLLGLSILSLAFAAVAAIASGGYRPGAYADGLEPILAAMVLAFGCMGLAFGLAAGAGIRAWLRDGERHKLAGILFVTGLTVGCASAVATFLGTPIGSSVLTDDFRVGFYISLGLLIAAVGWEALKGLMEAVRGRDWLRVALWFVTVGLLIGLTQIPR